jgi:hypothetical protein
MPEFRPVEARVLLQWWLASEPLAPCVPPS